MTEFSPRIQQKSIADRANRHASLNKSIVKSKEMMSPGKASLIQHINKAATVNTSLGRLHSKDSKERSTTNININDLK